MLTKRTEGGVVTSAWRDLIGYSSGEYGGNGQQAHRTGAGVFLGRPGVLFHFAKVFSFDGGMFGPSLLCIAGRTKPFRDSAVILGNVTKVRSMAVTTWTTPSTP